MEEMATGIPLSLFLLDFQFSGLDRHRWVAAWLARRTARFEGR